MSKQTDFVEATAELIRQTLKLFFDPGDNPPPANKESNK